MTLSLAEGASGLRFETWGIAGGFAALAGLALMRLLSENSIRGLRRGTTWMQTREGIAARSQTRARGSTGNTCWKRCGPWVLG